MACHGARRLGDMNRNLASIIGIELLVGAQGIGFRQPLATSQPLQQVIDDLRKQVPALENDRYMSDELETARQFVQQGDYLNDIAHHLPGLYQ